MIKKSELTKHHYKTGEVADLLGVSTKTVQTYDQEGKLRFIRSPGNRRLLARDDLIAFLKDRGLFQDDSAEGRVDVIYARVDGEEGDALSLDRQALFLVEQVHTLESPVILKEIGSGSDDQRGKLQRLLTMVCQGEVAHVYVTGRDRLAGPGFHYLETVFREHGTELVEVTVPEGENPAWEEPEEE